VCSLREVLNNIHHNVHYGGALSCNVRCTSAEVFANQIEQLSLTFNVGQQEDPSEFLIFLVDHLIQCLTIDDPAIGHIPVTPVHRIIGLHVQAISTCSVCSGRVVSKNWDSVLSIPIASHSNVIEAMKTYFSPEEMNGENLYQCNACQKHVLATRKIEITQAAPVIFIHLRRFEYDRVSRVTNKIQRKISYPDVLNLSNYFDEDIRQSCEVDHLANTFSYRLYGVVVHAGSSASSGHVFAYVH
jgi:ubiquitin carboxyl-terminal hydrolase 36/42